MNIDMITIITPTYNAKEYINAQRIRLGPLLKEHNIKWIIIDDASTDNTDILIEKINDSNIIYHKLITNSGPSAARYIGATLAETEFIFFLDADDILYNNDFIDFMPILEKNKIHDYVYTTVDITSKKNRLFSREQNNKDYYIIKKPIDFIKYGMPSYSSLFVKKDFFLKHVKSNNLPWGEDILSYLIIAQYGNGIKYKKTISCYIIHGDGRGSNLSLKNRITLFNSLLKETLIGPKKSSSLLFTLYLIIRYTASYAYKSIR